MIGGDVGKLSDVQLRHWVKAGKPITGAADGDGLTFTLSAKGAARWVFRFRYGAKQRELTLGRYPDFGVKEARKLATEARNRVHHGVDVARQKQLEKAAHAAAGGRREHAAHDVGGPALSAGGPAGAARVACPVP